MVDTPAPGLKGYHPEMGEPKPAAQIEAQLGHYGKHWYLWTPLVLEGRGIERLETETDAGHRQSGWHRYKVTVRAFDQLCQRYAVSSEMLL